MHHQSVRRIATLFLALSLGCHSDSTAPGGLSPIRNQVVFELFGSWGIGLVAPDGSDARIVPIGKDLALAQEPVVSPDGKRIAFTGIKAVGFQLDLYVMNADGSGRLQLTDDPAQDLGADWSPDGESIVFNSAPTGGTTSLVVIRADGSGRRELASDAAFGSWSPDGRRLAFSGLARGGNWTVNADGTDERALHLCDSGCDAVAPRWSPDGAWFAFAPAPGGHGGVAIVSTDGKPADVLMPTLAVGRPVWSPDGTRLAVIRIEAGHRLIYVVTRATHDTVRLPVEGIVSDWAR
jgi:Tol biopolymer transport system component